MANANVPQGLIPRMHRNGEPYSGAARVYFIPATDATAVGIGDPVTITGDSEANGVPLVTRSSVGGYITGVMVGISAASLNSSSLSTPYRVASIGTYVLVADNPDLVFEIQANGAVPSTDAGKNANLVFGALNTASGVSAAQLDQTTIATTNTLQLKVLRAVQRPDNALNPVGGPNTKLEVMINLHTHRNTTGT